MPSRSRSLARFLPRAAWAAGLGLALVLTANTVRAQPAPDAAAPMGPFQICEQQTYALCAVAACFVFDGVSYCRCQIKSGDSISLALRFDHGQDVCTVNEQGVGNGYMVSTYSLPPQVIAGVGNKALYDCPAATSTGAYAQCDGGICFRSSQGQSFPGFAKPLNKDQIICSCPITVANPQKARVGYQIVGPYPCQRSFFRNCMSPPASKQTGSRIYVGAPMGVPKLLTRKLYGFVPPINECRLPP